MTSTARGICDYGLADRENEIVKDDAVTILHIYLKHLATIEIFRIVSDDDGGTGLL